MNPWILIVILCVVSAGTGLLGALLSRLPTRWWAAGVAALLVLLLVLALWPYGRTERDPLAPLCLHLFPGRTDRVLMGCLSCTLLVSAALRVRRPLLKGLLVALAAPAVLGIAVFPYLMAGLLQMLWKGFPTVVDGDGVCLQSTPYTCGPASAVTALACLGLEGDEAEIARRACTNLRDGRHPAAMCAALEGLYGDKGISCESQRFAQGASIPPDSVAVAAVRLRPGLTHYVAVVEMTPERVVVGDPLGGRKEMTRAEFDTRWCLHAILVRRQGVSPHPPAP